MATSNVTGRTEPGISKYCITFGVSLAALILAGGVLVFSYWQHVELLHEGDRVGTRLERLGLIDREGAQHEPR
ncbi:hypothetical protein I5F50_30130 [Pseudomonas aeruginosa]|jgi:hypothetical protein|uniref:Uncharacterized protein n=1 Tax=Methylophilus rhizosphaerae TaxID=492660 RepID=A0A1G9FDL8_9PROT|nr:MULTISPECIES: hypothetical protein [Pseudomonadota]MBG4374751.1 hypothetical protein [Pseudomonas aeruginosa]MBG4465746.1 hypothetical protein [Pseudomonas aeruginosa]MBG4525477.1 hypothetical protein [Pseudomonas aeruginosa]MCE4131579.1 hypothetical protein [Burkholderia cepacia]SDK86293.1 hypothetical protein SAMN05192566_2704 [Methylophilus rhizosphaerae]